MPALAESLVARDLRRGLPAATCNQLQSDVAAEQDQLRDSFDRTEYKWYPVLFVGASYQF